MGGNLSLVAEFPDRAPVVLSGIAEARAEAKPPRRKRAWTRWSLREPSGPYRSQVEGGTRMDAEKLDVVRGSGNVFRDLARENADLEQLKALLAAEIIKGLDRTG